MGHGGSNNGSCQLLLICKSSKLSSYSLLKSIPKIPAPDLNKRGPLSNFALVHRTAILVSQGLTS